MSVPVVSKYSIDRQVSAKSQFAACCPVLPKDSAVPALKGLTHFLLLAQNSYSPGMNMLRSLIWSAVQAVQCIWQLAKYALSFLLALPQPKAILAARLLAVESQLAICKHRIQDKKNPRPRFTAAFRVL